MPSVAPILLHATLFALRPNSAHLVGDGFGNVGAASALHACYDLRMRIPPQDKNIPRVGYSGKVTEKGSQGGNSHMEVLGANGVAKVLTS